MSAELLINSYNGLGPGMPNGAAQKKLGVFRLRMNRVHGCLPQIDKTPTFSGTHLLFFTIKKKQPLWKIKSASKKHSDNLYIPVPIWLLFSWTYVYFQANQDVCRDNTTNIPFALPYYALVFLRKWSIHKISIFRFFGWLYFFYLDYFINIEI